MLNLYGGEQSYRLFVKIKYRITWHEIFLLLKNCVNKMYYMTSSTVNITKYTTILTRYLVYVYWSAKSNYLLPNTLACLDKINIKIKRFSNGCDFYAPSPLTKL